MAGSDEKVKHHEGGDGIAWESEEGLAVGDGYDGRLAGLDRNAVQQDSRLSELVEDGSGHVAGAEGASGREDQHVSRVDAVSSRFELGSVLVGHESYHNRLGSALGNASGDCVGVDVADLAALRTGVGRDKLVSGGDDCDSSVF